MVAVHPRLAVSEEQIEAFCQKWKVVRLELFGSVLRDDFGPESDIDVLVTFAPDVRVGLFALVRVEDDLRDLFGRDVDLVERKAIEESPNWIRRRAILDSARLVYAAAWRSSPARYVDVRAPHSREGEERQAGRVRR
jgi:hypothetical protein